MVVIYLRKSRADREAEARGEGETLARHEKILTSLADKMGLQVGGIYKELVSGETIAARPKMQQLLLEVMQGNWDGVLVMEVERLARGDTKDQGTVAEAFKFSGTKIITPVKTYDPNNEFDEEYFEFSLFMSRREYKTINRRIQTGRTAAFNDGWYIAGTAPYGYEKVKHKGDKGYTLEIVEAEADVVRMIFRLYTAGEPQADGTCQSLGSYQIRDRLNSLMIPSRSGGRWSASSITDILRNPIYTGYQRWSWRKVQKTLVEGSVIEKRPKNDDCPKVQGRFTPIISKELYDKAQEIRVSKKTIHIGARNAVRNPLSGLVYCGKCHTLMSRQLSNTKERYPVLRCPNNQCDNVSSPLDLVEQRVIDGLKDWVRQYELDWPEDSMNGTAATLEIMESNIKSLTLRQDQVKTQLSNAYDLLEQGVYPLKLFQERRTVLEGKKAAIELELANLEKERSEIEAREQARRDFIPNIKRIIEAYWNTEGVEARNSMLKQVLDRIEYTKTERTKKGTRDTAVFALHFYPRLPRR
ncbi:MAG: recombinase family protein [Lachnospiraceae bacterium]|jgi:site-specific DNA recombinase|nr:recombinase family protein [Lachnospiraceae bacterium]